MIRIMDRFLPALMFFVVTACGLAEDEQDEKNKYLYLTFCDKAFESYCLAEFDSDHNGRISRYEAQRVRVVSCPYSGIVSLSDLNEFSRLERLDCRGNKLVSLDLAATRLVWLDCSDNELVRLDADGLRTLVELRCRGNRLQRLDLQSNVSLAVLDASHNELAGVVDLSPCAPTLRADLRANEALERIYAFPSQGVLSDGITEVVHP